jgi:RsiW-degrading membrane proteinase PrsW (M82 family)
MLPENTKAAEQSILARELDLEGLHHFSLRDFLSETFKSYSWSQIETRLAVGTELTTPNLTIGMAQFPRPWLFVRILSATLLAYFIFLLVLSIYQEVAINAIPALIFTGCFAVPFAVLTLFFEINTPRNISIFQVVKLVMIGGALSFLLSFLLFDLFPLYKVYAASSAGLIEELAKIFVVVFMGRHFIKARHSYSLNGLLYGASIGTGFAAFESAGYALVAGLDNNSFAALNMSILLRGFLAPFMHITWTAIAAGAYWLAFRECGSFWRSFIKVRFLALFVISIMLHFIWNFDFGASELISNFRFLVIGLMSWVICFMLAATGYKEIKNTCVANATEFS